MLATDQALRQHFEFLAKGRRGKALAPDLFVQRVDQIDPAVLGFQRPVSGQAPGQRVGVQPFTCDRAQALLKRWQIGCVDGAARRHRVSTKTQQHAGMALGQQVQRVAQMKAGNRTPRALEFVFVAGCRAGSEDKGRAVQFVLDARSHDADHALVKTGIENADRRRWCQFGREQRLGNQQRLLAHRALDLAPVAVDTVQRFCQLVGTRGVVGQQALDAQRHVRQTSGSVDARAQCKAEVEGGGRGRLPTGGCEQRGQSGRHGQGAHALQALRHQAAVVGVELDHIGHRAQCYQRQQHVELGLRRGFKATPQAQLRAQRQQHVKHDAHAGDGFALKRAQRLVRVHDDVGLRQ